ncbi:BNR repeat protein [Hephaestia caeni]|uniref:BNR repeat protein n=1 Tax=Hephaestia caeni TaxID=645617 RepID=A0A397PHE6_9SPHN|nr:SUMF1/EgtB/PvdO family nonheme iron enzyme [Hephaestia caeni]RIA45544.1 BNR repeat protein [Hephaestia caeni]
MTRFAEAATIGAAIAVIVMPSAVGASPAPTAEPEMVAIPAGSFAMGAGADLPSRDWFNERPQHQVTISRGFRIATHEVTLAEYRAFRPDAVVTTELTPYVAGVSWKDAEDYAAWLSRKTGRHYRLPTEAEWEYVAKLKTADPGRYGAIQGLESGPLEWTSDWFGPYAPSPRTDPVGAASGMLKVVRGGPISHDPDHDWSMLEIDYHRAEARLALPPSFAPFADAPNGGGLHTIGIRLVEGPDPAGQPIPPTPPLNALGVRQDLSTAAMGPDPSKPYFRKRTFLPTPPDDSHSTAIDASGWDARLRNHHHSPGVAVMPNGDVLITIYTSYSEYEAGTSIIATRLRHGADQWDPPSAFVDIVGVNDHAPLLVRDGADVRFFWGSPFLGGQEVGPQGFPFQQIVTADSGATWSPILYPKVIGSVGGHTRQPINTAFRDRRGRLLLASDGGRDPKTGLGSGNEALLWASDDSGMTWYDTGGRTFGRHTTFVEGKDGRLLGYGGKNTDIDGFMPLATSHDGGKTYVKSKTPFPPLGSNQRPAVLRLASGRLLMIGDYVSKNDGVGPLPGKRGSYAAVSNDDGKTWRFKRLPGVNPHQDPAAAARMKGGTLGYAAMAQAPDGVIHVVTTMTHPIVTLAFNEAWLDAPEASASSDEALETSSITALTGPRKSFTERYSDGALRGTWSGGRADNGAFVFDGPQRWFYPDGKPAWEADYTLGRKTGVEKRFDRTGVLISERDYAADGRSTWKRWWANGKRRAISHWNGTNADGEAMTWDPEGRLLTSTTFHEGAPAGGEIIGAQTKGVHP